VQAWGLPPARRMCRYALVLGTQPLKRLKEVRQSDLPGQSDRLRPGSMQKEIYMQPEVRAALRRSRIIANGIAPLGECGRPARGQLSGRVAGVSMTSDRNA